jgi:hypothetical protein
LFFYLAFSTGFTDYNHQFLSQTRSKPVNNFVDIRTHPDRKRPWTDRQGEQFIENEQREQVAGKRDTHAGVSPGTVQ